MSAVLRCRWLGQAVSWLKVPTCTWVDCPSRWRSASSRRCSCRLETSSRHASCVTRRQVGHAFTAVMIFFSYYRCHWIRWPIRPGFSTTILYFRNVFLIQLCPGFLLDLIFSDISLENTTIYSSYKSHKLSKVNLNVLGKSSFLHVCFTFSVLDIFWIHGVTKLNLWKSLLSVGVSYK